MLLSKITFFERFEQDILSGAKTITLRDETESHVVAGQILPVSTFELIVGSVISRLLMSCQ